MFSHEISKGILCMVVLGQVPEFMKTLNLNIGLKNILTLVPFATCAPITYPLPLVLDVYWCGT